MKKKNAFTLIELLAIIVILAIIAVITVPIILNIIDNSKKGAVQDSAYGYKDAINKMYVSKLTENPDYSIPNNSYNMSQLKDMGVTVSGQEPDSNSWVQIENNKVLTGCLQFDEYKVNITEGKVGNAEKGTCSPKLAISGDGLYEAQGEPGRYVYRGADPDNRIYLKEDGINNTLYRIVSYEPDGTIKVVRDEKLSSGKAFDERDSSDKTTGPRHNENNTFCNYTETYYGCNVWGNMNNTYYNGQTLSPNFKYRFYSNNSSETLQEHSNTGTVNTDSTLNQYLNGTWLTSALSNYIESHNFNVGGVYYNMRGIDLYSGVTCEDKGIIKEKEEEKLYTWTGKVGLLNITDYVESSTNSSCTDVWLNFYYNPDKETNRTSNEWPCKYDNYNYKSGYNQWSLSPYSNDQYTVWYVSTSGYLSSSSAFVAFDVRPAFYLKSSVKLGGLGTSDEPYYIES